MYIYGIDPNDLRHLNVYISFKKTGESRLVEW